MHVRGHSVLTILVAVAACALTAVPASGHGIVTVDDELLSVRATDYVSRSTLTVTQTRSSIRIVDSTGFGGLDPGDCRPGRVAGDTGYVVEAICRRSGIAAIRVNVGEREDDVTVKSSLPTRVIAGGGADRITTGTGDDHISAGAGDDVVEPGAGTDKVNGGQGHDTLRLADGDPDETMCGTGTDASESDAFDRFGGDCERAPLGALAAGADDGAPHLGLRAATRQRAFGGKIGVRVTSDEPTTFVAQAAIVIGDTDHSLRPGRARLRETAGAVTLRPQMSARVRRIVRRALDEHRRVRLYIAVVGTDDHGNSALVNARTITLVP